MLSDSGSIFVQISDENLHRVRMVMDEVFGPQNFVSIITFVKTGGFSSSAIKGVSDYILWYFRNRGAAKVRNFVLQKGEGGAGADRYDQVELSNGLRCSRSQAEQAGFPFTEKHLFQGDNFTSQGNPLRSLNFNGQTFDQPFKTNDQGLQRLVKAGRVVQQKNNLRYVRLLKDFEASQLTNVWDDIGGIQSRADPKVYVVQTATEAIKRCLLITTDPSDLVLDPTCGSGTTAYVAEQWGRRWITTDTSRVSLAIARQRLLTAKFDYYPLREPDKGVAGGFVYKTVPHITLKSIAQNVALDPLFAKWDKILTEKLEWLNLALEEAAPELRRDLLMKLERKRKQRDRSDPVTDADVRRWTLPEPGTGWQEWQVPFDTDPDWPETLRDALTSYRESWRAKMDAVNAVIAASAEQEALVDQPAVDKKVLRVSGPFTIEGVLPAEESLDLDDGEFGGAPEAMETFAGSDGGADVADEPINAEAYLDKMIRLLKADGVRFLDNKMVTIADLQPLSRDVLHAEGEWELGGETRRVAVAFGPQYGPVTARMVEDCLRRANRRGYDDLLLAGFSFDGAAQAVIQEDENPNVRCHMTQIRPDVNMGDLLKTTASSQLFTVSGLPRVSLKEAKDGEYVVTMEGVDIYDPVGNTIRSAGADKVAAWFLDADYDGGTFCVTQAFFPDPKAWGKFSKALTGVVDADRFATFSGTTSLPFPPGEHKRAAVKVIDPRGNEVMRVLSLGAAHYA